MTRNGQPNVENFLYNVCYKFSYKSVKKALLYSSTLILDDGRNLSPLYEDWSNSPKVQQSPPVSTASNDRRSTRFCKYNIQKYRTVI